MALSLRNKDLRACGLVLAGSLLLILSFPKISWSFLAWFAFLPFFKAIEQESGPRRFRLGTLAGLVSGFGIFYWVTHSMRYYGGLDTLTSFSILCLMVFYLALYLGAFGWLWGLFPANSFFSLLWAPAVWVGLEGLRAKLLTGFPWALLGYSQYNWLPIIQITEITGVFGISFLIILVNQTLYQCFLAGPASRSWSQKWKEVLFTGGLVALVLGFGFHSITLQKEKDKGAETAKVAVLQGNIDQSLKWNQDFQEQTIRIYRDLSLKDDLDSDLMIWPETAVPFYFLNENRLTPRLFDLTRETGSHLLFGSPAFGHRQGQIQYYNRAYLLSPEGRISFYDKVHLVPFGEYVPLKRFLPFVGKMVQAIGDFSPGEGSYGLSLPKGKVGVLICFETIFPELSRTLKQEGCSLLVNLTNDAWFGRTSAPYQHLSMLTFRAVENRVWVARAANTGISAFIDSTGSIRQTYPLFQRGGIHAIIPLRPGLSFYTRYGDLILLLCTLIYFWGAWRWIKRRKRLANK
jgi:apolipoprotein N-acyltransferase